MDFAIATNNNFGGSERTIPKIFFCHENMNISTVKKYGTLI